MFKHTPKKRDSFNLCLNKILNSYLF